ncbi:tRNA-guanine transglycosylase DpdA [Myxococcus sp. Y35]|uniref:tRNA-guanine transglycosylase DpdA n=1 Tax=Pseudomyxococcus flavus TaxID=3115648 RepID=UPI003CFA89C4
MKFFFPDSQDLVDPSFDFESERRDDLRVRQRDDLYAHEVFRSRAYDGLLVSKGIVDGYGQVGSRYTIGQKHRLIRNGVKEFLRLESVPYPLEVMGDCGAFTYVKEKEPPYTADEVINFYADCRFDYGLSVDHVILAYQPDWDKRGAKPPDDVKDRQALTLSIAEEFWMRCKTRKEGFVPIGVAQGWSPKSYAHAVKELQAMGYTYIALGGMVPLKTAEILASLEKIAEVRKSKTRLHLLGVTRPDHMTEFSNLGVASLDGTSPLRQAFKDASDNYHTLSRTYSAIRIPQVEGNPKLQKKISSGVIRQETARKLEKSALAAMAAFDKGSLDIDATVAALIEYEELCAESTPMEKKAGSAKRRYSRADVYREVLSDRPWRKCGCEVCRSIGHHVILFRGAERNRRRGFHNVWVFYRRLRSELGLGLEDAA